MKYLNALTVIDGYKVDHRSQYQDNTTLIVSNSTPRSSKRFTGLQDYDGKYVNFGLFIAIDMLHDLFDDTFFCRPKNEVIRQYKRRVDEYLGTDLDVSHIEQLHDYGKLPIKIYALPEGVRVPAGVPNFVIHNTEGFFWITNMLETYLQSESWQPIVSATTGYELYRLCKKYTDITCDNDLHMPFQLHDFSMRGMPGVHAAAKSGAGHLLGTQGLGTDTLPAIDLIEYLYGTDGPIGLSVPASEHSVMTQGIQKLVKEGMTEREAETEVFRRLIQDVYPSGIVSIVSDSYDFWGTITDTARELKDIILARTGSPIGVDKLVFRPDSGDPVEVVCGKTVKQMVSQGPLTWEEDVPVDGPEGKGAVEVLWDIFGGTINEKGYKVLNPKVGLIYGDGITLRRAQEILEKLEAKGFASSNIVFGIGSYTYQYVTRDTLGVAMKATYSEIDGKSVDIYKSPKTDAGKTSAKGLLKVVKQDNEYKLIDGCTWEEFHASDNELKLLYDEGEFINTPTWDVVKQNLKDS